MIIIQKKETPCRYGAPICLVVAYDKNHTFTYPGERMNSGIEDAAIVATHLLLGAANAGVDSCWVNFFDPDKLANAKKDLCILHPLPRVNEISTKGDADPRAMYFEQVRNGRFVRMALISTLLEGLYED